MKLFILAYSFFSLLIISSLHVVAQTQKDTLFAYLSETPVVILSMGRLMMPVGQMPNGTISV